MIRENIFGKLYVRFVRNEWLLKISFFFFSLSFERMNNEEKKTEFEKRTYT